MVLIGVPRSRPLDGEISEKCGLGPSVFIGGDPEQDSNRADKQGQGVGPPYGDSFFLLLRDAAFVYPVISTPPSILIAWPVTTADSSLAR